ncbi:MAG TPA: hypothetical protein VGJ98_08205 [Candidatus Eisenbacteria bacterium]
MKRFAAVLALAAALLGSTLAGTALGQDSDAPQDLASPQAFSPTQDGNDSWAKDSYRDDGSWNGRDRNGRGWGQGRFHLSNLEGRWVADDRSANYRSDRRDFRGRGVMSGMLLPDFIRIDQRPSMVRIADSRNRPLQRIMIGGKFDSRYGNQYGSRPDYLTGRWRGRTLVVEQTGPRGAAITQTFALENRGRTLVVRTSREGFGRRGTIEFSTFYHRA